jgi:hypothetical protein
MDNASVELYIDRGNAEENKRIFDKLFEHKDEIEAIFGAPLEWQRMNERRSSRVRYTLNIGGLASLLGLMVCGVGYLFTGFWAVLVQAHLFGQVVV